MPKDGIKGHFFGKDILQAILNQSGAEGIRMYSVTFKDCLFTGLNQFTMSYSEVTPEFRTFECTFAFNEINMDFQTQ